MRHFDSNLCWKLVFNPLNLRDLWMQLMLSLTFVWPNRTARFGGLFYLATTLRSGRFTGPERPSRLPF